MRNVTLQIVYTAPLHKVASLKEEICGRYPKGRVVHYYATETLANKGLDGKYRCKDAISSKRLVFLHILDMPVDNIKFLSACIKKDIDVKSAWHVNVDGLSVECRIDLADKKEATINWSEAKKVLNDVVENAALGDGILRGGK